MTDPVDQLIAASELPISTRAVVATAWHALIASAQARIDDLYKVSQLKNLLHAFAETAATAQRGLPWLGCGLLALLATALMWARVPLVASRSRCAP